MRTLLVTLVLLCPATAMAWDGPDLWYAPVDGDMPGGGGILGTGGAHDHGIKCLDCHQEREETTLDLTFSFTPPLDLDRYTPGQRYRVDVAMLDEQLGPPCDQYMVHVNNFAAEFQNAAGDAVGTLESDNGISAGSCPTDFTDPTTGTTALYRDCEVVFPRRAENLTSWTFYWTAPSTASEVRLYYGAVDGDCMMSSLGDAVVAGNKVMLAAAARVDHAPAVRPSGHASPRPDRGRLARRLPRDPFVRPGTDHAACGDRGRRVRRGQPGAAGRRDRRCHFRGRRAGRVEHPQPPRRRGRHPSGGHVR